MILPEQTIKNFKNIIESNVRFVIITHVNPDGDTIGAALAWYNLLLNMGKTAVVVSPNDCPDFLKWLNGCDLIIPFKPKETEAREAFEAAEVLLCVDFNHVDRVEGAKVLLENFKGPKLLIDHHPSPQDFVDHKLSFTESSSTSEISYWTICALGYRQYLTRQVAEALYTGIITDTGGLSHNSSNPETYHAVADLLSCGIDKSEIHNGIFNNYTEGRMRLLGDVLGRNLRVLYDSNTAYMFITESQQKFFGFQPGDSEGFVNIPLSIKGIRFCALFTEMADQVKISFRSKGSFPANEFSEKYFSGGGHLNAAGGKFKGKLFDAMHLFEEGVRVYKDRLVDSASLTR